MKPLLARWCIQLALRLDPGHPLHHLRAIRGIDNWRGFNGTRVVILTFDEFNPARDFVAYIHSEKDEP